MVKLLEPIFSPNFKKQYKRLPQNIQRKFTKKLQILLDNYKHPSLRTHKMGGTDKYEARIDLHYRFTFEISNGSLLLRNIGPHDEGLGKK